MLRPAWTWHPFGVQSRLGGPQAGVKPVPSKLAALNRPEVLSGKNNRVVRPDVSQLVSELAKLVYLPAGLLCFAHERIDLVLGQESAVRGIG
jgi:hypothetical protein